MIDTPSLRWLAYSSTATAPFDDLRLAQLLERSRTANQRQDVTGMLLHRKGRFIQFLEGPHDAVASVMERIGRDSRHTDIRILIDTATPARHFTEWTMGYEPLIDTDQPAPAGFRDTFADLENAPDDATALRAAHELTLWFRARADTHH